MSISSVPVPTNTETITPTDGARGSSVFTLFLDDSYMLVRQTYLPTASNTKSEPLEAPSEIEEPQLLSLTSTPPLLDYTPTTPYTDDESDSLKTSETRSASPHFTTSPTDFTPPPSP
nr:hypothetical protein [Tanacetum cinerariifolium]